jgi:hypothetical protein
MNGENIFWTVQTFNESYRINSMWKESLNRDGQQCSLNITKKNMTHNVGNLGPGL